MIDKVGKQDGESVAWEGVFTRRVILFFLC